MFFPCASLSYIFPLLLFFLLFVVVFGEFQSKLVTDKERLNTGNQKRNNLKLLNLFFQPYLLISSTVKCTKSQLLFP